MKKTTTIDAAKGTSGEDWARRLQNWFAWSSAATFAVMGLLMLDAAAGEERRMRLLLTPDAIFGIRNEALLDIAGLLHLVLCGALLAARDPVTRAGLAGWAGLNYLVYRWGMAWEGVAAPVPGVQLISQKILRVTPATLEAAWKLFTVYLLGGAAALLVLEFRGWRRRRKEAFIEHWREVREVSAPATPVRGGRASARAVTSSEGARNQGSRVEPLVPLSRPEGTLSPFERERERERGPSIESRLIERVHAGPPGEPATGDFKFSCPACGQHIRCDAVYAGRQVTCPACKKPITVPT